MLIISSACLVSCYDQPAVVMGDETKLIDYELKMLEYNPYKFNSDFDNNYYLLNYRNKNNENSYSDFYYYYDNRELDVIYMNIYNCNPCLFFCNNKLYYNIGYKLYDLSSDEYQIINDNIINTLSTGDDIYFINANTRYTFYLSSLNKPEKRLFHSNGSFYSSHMFFSDDSLYTTCPSRKSGDWGSEHFFKYSPRDTSWEKLTKIADGEVVKEYGWNLSKNEYFVLNNKVVCDGFDKDKYYIKDEKDKKILTCDIKLPDTVNYYSRYLWNNHIYYVFFYNEKSYNTQKLYTVTIADVDIDSRKVTYNTYSEEVFNDLVAPIKFNKYVMDGYTYLICKNAVYKYNLSTTEYEMIISDEKEISNIYILNNEGMFYQTIEFDETIYNPIYTLYYYDYSNTHLIAKFQIDLGLKTVVR